MSKQGVTYHLRGASRTEARKALAQLSGPSALLGVNRRWTSIAALSEEGVDGAALAVASGKVVLTLWFDEDSILTLQAKSMGLTDFTASLASRSRSLPHSALRTRSSCRGWYD